MNLKTSKEIHPKKVTVQITAQIITVTGGGWVQLPSVLPFVTFFFNPLSFWSLGWGIWNWLNKGIWSIKIAGTNLAPVFKGSES